DSDNELRQFKHLTAPWQDPSLYESESDVPNDEREGRGQHLQMTGHPGWLMSTLPTSFLLSQVLLSKGGIDWNRLPILCKRMVGCPRYERWVRNALGD